MKNSFRKGQFHEEVIVDEKGTEIGTIRIKPNAVLWRPKGSRKKKAGKYYWRSLEEFHEFMVASKRQTDS